MNNCFFRSHPSHQGQDLKIYYSRNNRSKANPLKMSRKFPHISMLLLPPTKYLQIPRNLEPCLISILMDIPMTRRKKFGGLILWEVRRQRRQHQYSIRILLLNSFPRQSHQHLIRKHFLQMKPIAVLRNQNQL